MNIHKYESRLMKYNFHEKVVPKRYFELPDFMNLLKYERRLINKHS